MLGLSTTCACVHPERVCQQERIAVHRCFFFPPRRDVRVHGWGVGVGGSGGEGWEGSGAVHSYYALGFWRRYRSRLLELHIGFACLQRVVTRLEGRGSKRGCRDVVVSNLRTLFFFSQNRHRMLPSRQTTYAPGTPVNAHPSQITRSQLLTLPPPPSSSFPFCKTKKDKGYLRPESPVYW